MKKGRWALLTLLFSCVANASEAPGVCNNEAVVSTIIDSLVELIEVIQPFAARIDNVSQATVKGSGLAICTGTFIYYPLQTKDISFGVQYVVEEDFDNLYVTLLQLSF